MLNNIDSIIANPHLTFEKSNRLQYRTPYNREDEHRQQAILLVFRKDHSMIDLP